MSGNFQRKSGQIESQTIIKKLKTPNIISGETVKIKIKL